MMTKRMRTLVGYLLAAIGVGKRVKFPDPVNSPLSFGSDSSINRICDEMFLGWEKEPKDARAQEIKGLLRWCASNKGKLRGLCGRSFPARNWNSVVCGICSAVFNCPSSQTDVNTAVNAALRGRYSPSTPYELRGVLEHLLAPVPNRKLEAIRRKVRAVRLIASYSDEDRDWEVTLPVEIVWHGRVVARTWRHQVGACLQSHGKTEWEYSQGWEEMLSTPGREGWPEFRAHGDEERTYREIW